MQNKEKILGKVTLVDFIKCDEDLQNCGIKQMIVF